MRKFFFFLALLFVSSITFAQTLRVHSTTVDGGIKTDSLWFTDSEYVNYVFGSLNLSEVTSNHLLQRSLGYFPPLAFDGKNSNDSTIRSRSRGFEVYSTYYYSALDTNGTYAVQHPSVVRNQISSLNSTGVVPILFINRNYHSIRQDALTAGLFTTNSDSTKIFDNLSRTQSPYELHRLFVGFACPASKTYRSYGDVMFSFAPTGLNFTDTIAGQIQVDFGDGKGFINVTAGQTVNVYYSTSGTKTIVIKQGGRESRSDFAFQKRDVFFPVEEITIAEEEASRTANLSLFSTSQPIVTRVLSCDNVFDKPIVVVEGFSIEMSDQLGPEDVLGQLGGSLTNRLSDLGYDFVVVQFSNNAASITENAMALRKAIQKINEMKVGTNKLQVIGLSMGGLIAKYCLKDMEDNSLDHNVANYFSYDAPHQGAYAPLGLQYLIADFSYAVKDARQNEELQFLLERLQSPAAKQLLQLQMGSYGDRSTFAAAYAAKGYPTLCNNYGIANGRGDGVGLGYSGADKLIDFYAEYDAWIGKFLKHKQELWTLNTSYSKVYSFSNKGHAPFFGLKGMKRYSSDMKMTAEMVHETLPGSTVDMAAQYGFELKSNFTGEVPTVELDLFGKYNTTFVPTVSALDLNNQSYSSGYQYFSRNAYYNIQANHATVLSSNITPFDDIVYPVGYTLSHLASDFNIEEFIIQKIYGSSVPYTCGGACVGAISFSGLTNDCSSKEATIVFSNIPFGSVINWVVPSGVTILRGQGTNSITVRVNGPGVFNGHVEVTRPGCTTINQGYTLTFTQPSLSISGPSNICGPTTYTLSSVPVGASVTWSAESPEYGWAFVVSSTNQSATFDLGEPGYARIKATVTTACGSYDVLSNLIEVGLPYFITMADIYCEDGCVGGGYFLCTDPSPYDPHNNLISYQINATPAYPVTLNWKLSDAYYNTIQQSSTTVTTTTGYVYLPRNLPQGYIGVEVWLSGGACNADGLLWEGSAEVSSCGYASRMVAYPNPSNTELKVSYLPVTNKTANSKQMPTEHFSVKLLDQKGKVVKEGSSRGPNNDIVLKVADLANGIYFLHITEGKKVSKQQVVIFH